VAVEVAAGVMVQVRSDGNTDHREGDHQREVEPGGEVAAGGDQRFEQHLLADDLGAGRARPGKGEPVNAAWIVFGVACLGGAMALGFR